MFYLQRQTRPGITLLELIITITVLAILAAVIVPRFGGATANAKREACRANCRNLEVQSRLWQRTKGTWPAANLSDLGANSSFMPEGLPTCPVDGSSYSLDGTTHEITGHSH